MRLIDSQEPDWNEPGARWLVIGGLLVTACFFVGQNIYYRGIYFLLVLPGLVHYRRSAQPPALRRFWGK